MSAPHLLVVDDNASARNFLVDFLRELGCDASAEPDGPSALRHARRDPPDLIFMDMRLPGLDGPEVLHRLRRIRGLERVPVVGISGFAYPRLVEDARREGCVAFLAKPLDLDEVREKLASILGFRPRGG